MPVRPARLRALLLLPFLLLGGCIKERHFLIMESHDGGADIDPERGVEIVGEVSGEAHYRQLLTLFANSNLQGLQGTLLTSDSTALLEERLHIPVLEPVFARLSAILNGSTRIGTAQRVAMGRALLGAQELGADAVLAPRIEIVTRSLTFVVPLGWIYSTGAVEVKAKAVRLGGPRGDDAR